MTERFANGAADLEHADDLYAERSIDHEERQVTVFDDAFRDHSVPFLRAVRN